MQILRKTSAALEAGIVAQSKGLGSIFSIDNQTRKLQETEVGHVPVAARKYPVIWLPVSSGFSPKSAGSKADTAWWRSAAHYSCQKTVKGELETKTYSSSHGRLALLHTGLTAQGHIQLLKSMDEFTISIVLP